MGLDMTLFLMNPKYDEHEAFLTYEGLPYEVYSDMKVHAPEYLPFWELKYWRKANMVHRFLMECEGDWVENIGDEVDHDCGYKHILNVEIDRLYDLCKAIVDKGFDYEGEHYELTVANLMQKELDEVKPSDVELCKTTLPVGEGFFFGSYAYDGSYLWGIADTYEAFTKLRFDEKLDGDLYYHPWW